VSLDAKGQCAYIVNLITLNIVNIITSLRADSTQTKKRTGAKLHGKGKRGSLSQGNILLIFWKFNLWICIYPKFLEGRE
jgi:hypothetical protein